MDRRDFLKLAAAVPAAAALPALAFGEAPITATEIKDAVEKVWGYSQGPWYIFLHPEQERALRDLQARERWQFAYQAWRKDGRPELTCQQVLDKYAPISEWEFPARTGEVGSFENIRFIEQESV